MSLETGPGIVLGGGSRNGEYGQARDSVVEREEKSGVLLGRDAKTTQHDQNSN